MKASAARLRSPAPAAPVAAGDQAYALVRELYPICRSITGRGVRQTLDILERHIPLQRTAVASGTRVFDWTVPPEWNIEDAWIKDLSGRRVVDFHAHNLHVVGYSTPVRARMKLEDLAPHLHSLPEQPDWIPYRTSYWRERWGFCLTQRQRESLRDAEYDVCIDATLAPGELTLAECVLPGEVPDEVLVYTHTCHPSLCNDNLSALAVTTLLAQRWRNQGPHHYTYRFVFAPTTIGSIAWLCLNEARTGAIRHGLVLASLGDRGAFTYKRSRRGTADIDRIAEHVVGQAPGARVEDFSPYGYDERQFCSPGFNLPVGRLTRTPNGCYPEYHTSADDLHFVTPRTLGESLETCAEILATIDGNARFLNLSPKCEPRLGARGLFATTGGRGPGDFELALLWVLNQSDGGADLLAIATRSHLPFRLIASAAQALARAGLLRRLDPTAAAHRVPAPAG
jgi:aminopeptidase-like protein